MWSHICRRMWHSNSFESHLSWSARSHVISRGCCSLPTPQHWLSLHLSLNGPRRCSAGNFYSSCVIPHTYRTFHFFGSPRVQVMLSFKRFETPERRTSLMRL